MRELLPEHVDAYSQRRKLTPDVARRDYVLLRIAEALYRDEAQHAVYVCKGAFVLHFLYDNPRASKDIDGIIGTSPDKLDVTRIRELILRGIQDQFKIDIPKIDEREAGQKSVAFAPINFSGAEVGDGSVELEISLRENLVFPARRSRINVPEYSLSFDVTHIDLDEQVAEKMRCLADRSKVTDAYDVWWLWQRRDMLDRDRIRQASANKLASSKDHHAAAARQLEARERAWATQLALIPLDAPDAPEVFRTCRAAFKEWVA